MSLRLDGSASQSLPGSRGTALPRCWRRQCRNKSATDCAGTHASMLRLCTSLRRSVPVRVHRRTPLDRHCCAHSFGPSRPRPVRPSANPRCRSLSGSGSLRSPSPCTAKARQPSRTRPPPRPASASLRLLGHCQTRSRRTRPPHQPRACETGQQPRPTGGLTPQPQCVIDRPTTPEGQQKGINIYQGVSGCRR